MTTTQRRKNTVPLKGVRGIGKVSAGTVRTELHIHVLLYILSFSCVKWKVRSFQNIFGRHHQTKAQYIGKSKQLAAKCDAEGHQSKACIVKGISPFSYRISGRESLLLWPLTVAVEGRT